MRVRGPLAVALISICTVVIGVAAPAGASTRTRTTTVTTTAGPTCHIYDPEAITGAMLVNNQLVNGTWIYATGVQCTSEVGDIALYEELDFNGTKVDSKYQPFTGVARSKDAILKQTPCAVCNGTWKFVWAQVIKATSGFSFVNPPMGCVLYGNGLYLVCVETSTVTL